jgi:hypothetical protein
MNATYGEAKDTFYCPDCAQETEYILEKRRVVSHRTELSRRDRSGGKEDKGGKRWR